MIKQKNFGKFLKRKILFQKKIFEEGAGRPWIPPWLGPHHGGLLIKKAKKPKISLKNVNLLKVK